MDNENEDVVLEGIAPEVENEVFGFEVGEEEVVDPTLALQARIAELEAGRVTTPAPTPALDISGLAAEIAKIQGATAKPATPTTPQVNLEELAKSLDPDFYKSPSQAVLKLMQPILMEQQALFAKKMAEQETQTSQALAIGSEANKSLFAKYGAEINEEAKNFKGATAYQQAIDKVKMTHFNDIMQEQVAAQVAIAMEAAKVEAAKVAPPAGYTNAGRPVTARPAAVRVTPAQLARMNKWMLVKGFDQNDPGDKEFAYNLMKEGKI